MYDAKEQAKVYLDGIRTSIKNTNTTLLLFLPVLAILLLEIKKNYTLVEQHVVGRSNRFGIAQQQKDLNRQIEITSTEIRKLSSSFQPYKDAGRDSNTIKTKIEEAKKQIIDFRKIRKEKREIQKLNINRAKGINDTLQNLLADLKIAVELPIIKNTQTFSIRSVTVATMFVLTFVLWFTYDSKQKIRYYIKKFIYLQKHQSLEAKGVFHNFALNLPFWCFPLKSSQFNAVEQRFLPVVAGTNNKGLANRNITSVSILLSFLFLNIFLCGLNWDINYKVFHLHYSFFIALGFLLLLIDLLLVYLFVKPPFYSKVTPRQKNPIHRKEFILLTSGTLASFLFEPVFATISNGRKWFNSPRFVHQKKSTAITLSNGFYTNISKSKKKFNKLYFVQNNKASILKTVTIPAKFLSNLKSVKFTEVFGSPYLLGKFKEKDLLRFLTDKKIQADKLRSIEMYMAGREDSSISPTLIDYYSKLYSENKNNRKIDQQVSAKFNNRIKDIDKNIKDHLPEKYKTSYHGNVESEKEKHQKIQKELIAQMRRRIANWNGRMTNAGKLVV